MRVVYLIMADLKIGNFERDRKSSRRFIFKTMKIGIQYFFWGYQHIGFFVCTNNRLLFLCRVEKRMEN